MGEQYASHDRMCRVLPKVKKMGHIKHSEAILNREDRSGGGPSD